MLRAVAGFFAAVSMFLFAAGSGAEEARLLRFADIHGDRVAFVYAGDIWLASSDGGEARRLTSHEGMELFPKFSPDGKRIAFSAEYGGNRQIYVVGVEGGTPEQLTWYNDVGSMPPRGGFDYRVLDWTPDGKHILFRGNRLPWGVRMGRLFLIAADGGMETPLEIPESGAGMFSPDGKKIVYTPIDREWRTWKRHVGGRAQDVWTYDLEKHTSTRLTDWRGTDNQPMWVGSTIYYTSDDTDGRLNIWACDEDGRNKRKVTRHENFDVLWPSAGPSSIVYEAGGYLYKLDPASGQASKIEITLHGDFLARMPYRRNVSEMIGSGDISPSAKRAVFDARGDIFTVPAEDGEIRNLTRTSGIREMQPVWSPDGDTIAYLSDRNGEYDLYVRPQDGSGAERRVTTDGDTWRFPPVWSPDSKKLAFGDTKQRLRYVDVESGKIIDVDRGTYGPITTYDWSPDSRWIVYTKADDAQFSSIWVHSLDDGDSTQLTGDYTDDFSPSFDPKGRYLYFLSDRDYNLQFSGYEFNYFYTDPTRVYAALLKVDGPALFQPKSDEEASAKADDEGDEKKNGKGEKDGDKKEEELKIEIDFEGFDHRVVALPGGPSNFGSVQAVDDGVLFVHVGDNGPEVRKFSIESEEVETIIPRVGNFSVSKDGKKLLYRSGNDYGIVDVKKDQKPDAGRLDLSGMTMRIDPTAEWRQIFLDGWRITRDWFYDEGMHGIDWQEIHDLYAPLVPHVAHRGDLDYILGEMGGELNAGHFYVNWGDFPRPERVDNGLLGAEIVADSGYFKIDKIFAGENWHDNFRSPLTEPTVNVSEGEWILAVDGRSAKGVDNFYELLEGAAGRTVVLRVNNKPKEDGARDVSVRPIARETDLRYLDWAQERLEMVDRLSDGRIGYIHLPNTAFEGNRELRKGFYPQAHKDALIFDARYNGGGFIPDRMMELISRKRLSLWARRGIEPFDTPGYYHEGPKACLMNGYSSSGGDAFPYYFRKLGLGPLIGTRTWGGLIGLSGNPGFMDGGSLSVPTFRFLDTEGNWAVENEGVAPDVEVIDLPERVAKGEDPSLEKAVEMLLEELKRNPPKEIDVPTPPREKR
ncbi:MAG: acetyl-CoA synthetase [Acidobacteria bacterium]|nr:acetyl-CoA synthetase [Acidobacteriota bacterium]NIM61740.1 acetyl-CoA synthetase [Acidobacteriota bacterium]NIO58920.1 acetyl-CoA synthetase [Acidobacteriota bacterium]NIQ29974.1 acetyl-CoA synthetase [Acidobacteriota bacterium]NIQ84707.1 acetyl-CoA synthetase [Acidobacteriota bacterium]